MAIFKFVAVAALGLSLAACEAAQKEQLGALFGGAAGAVIGAQVGDGKGQLAAVAVGAVAGALIGSEIGKSLDRADQLYMQQTAQRSLDSSPAGTTSTWQNPDSGHSGTVTPTRTYKKNNGEYCREFQQTVTIGGNIEEAYGTACRQEDGTWMIVNS